MIKKIIVKDFLTHLCSRKATVTSMLANVTNKVLAAYYFSKKDVMAISTFKKLKLRYWEYEYVSEQEGGEKRNRVEERG